MTSRPGPSRLADSTSPYLLAHAGNPVDWWPWGPGAFAEARRRDVPVFVSVGYATCHWCHVMARESFSDPEIAAYLNAHFVAIKVDREEHPDVDAAMLAQAGAFTQNLGWPLSVVTTPEGGAFYAGTYFPPRATRGVPAFREVLEAIVAAWAEHRDEVGEVGASLVEALAAARAPGASGGAEGGTATAAVDLDAAAAAIEALDDPEFGGLGRGPKFPNVPVLSFFAERGPRGFAERTLATMAASPLRDPVDGGFFRYATRRDWSEPHYERMLSDNAQLLALATRLGHAATATGIAGFLLDTLRLPSGAFASAQDSESVLAGERSEGGWYRLDAAERGRHPAPSLDGKVLAGLNGLAIGALAAAGARFARPDWIAAAVAAADALPVRGDGRLVRSSLDGRASDAIATLEDYGGVAGGLLRLALATGDVRHAIRARELLARCRDGAPDGADPVLAAQGLALAADLADGATPSGPALLADAALLLATLTGEESDRALADRAIAPALAEAEGRASAYGAALAIAARLARPARQLVVVGQPDSPLTAVARAADADAVAIVTPDQAAAFADAGFELFAGRVASGGIPTAYWCEQSVCRLPTVSPEELAALLAGFRPTPDDERVLRQAARPGESTSDTLRRAPRLLDHEHRLEQFRHDAEALKDEDIGSEQEAW